MVRWKMFKMFMHDIQDIKTIMWKNKSNLNKVVVLSVDVLDVRLVVGRSSVVPSVPSVVPDPDPDS